MEEEEWEEEVVKLLLTGFDGRAKFYKVKNFMHHRNLVGDMGMTGVLRRMTDSSRFLVFQKNKSVKYISVFCEDASICFPFQKEGYEKCINRNCSKFHVCKYFISGNCTKSSNCHLGHDLQNETNRKVSERLGLSSFSADELHTIISRSNPAVCMKHNARGCDDDDCPDLHICSLFILQRCTAGADCRFGHSLLASDHNEWVLDTFNVSYMTEEELRSIILVRGIVDAPQMRPATSSLSLLSNYTATSSTSLAEEDTDEYVTRVFRFLLLHFGGRAQFSTFLIERRRHLQFMRQVNITRWLKDHMDRFLLFERSGDVKYVSVYSRQAKVCFGYNSSGCNNKSCKFFHVCKRFVAGNCVQTSCPLSHSFSSEPNAKAYSLLKLDHFTTTEISKIFFYSNPAVCEYHNTSGCFYDGCTDLHVCAKDLLSLCTSGVDCKFGHVIRDSGEHNSYVLKAFRMDTWEEHVLRKLVIIKGDCLNTPEGASTPSSQASPTGDQLADNNKSVKLHTLVSFKDTVPRKYEYICETYTWTGACPNSPHCPRYHNPDRLPYLWLVLEDGKWRRVLASVSINLETCFCDLGDILNKKFSIRGIEHMDFNTMSAISDGTTFKMKRLSTPSYVTATPGTPLNFYTQWVWYRQERDGTYTPFYPGSLQYTLEEKYLMGQHKYYFEFEDLRLMVDTHSLPMTQTNLHTQGGTPISRRPVFEPTKKSEVPKMSSLLLAEVSSVVHQVPKHWSAVDHFQDFELVELESADPEYITVQRQFFSTMSMTEQKIVHMFRVQNPGLWDKYCSARRAMAPRGQRPEEVEERQLFHGTPTLQAARGICANSFDFRRSGENVGAIHGKGAYFSTTAKFSHSYTRVHTPVTGDPLRFMFLGRILVGQYTLGHPSYTKPPERDRLKLYDSCVNDLSNPSIFVIFDLAQSYPEYLIQYTDVLGKKQQSQVRTSVSVPSLAQSQPSLNPSSRQSLVKKTIVQPSTVNYDKTTWSRGASTPLRDSTLEKAFWTSYRSSSRPVSPYSRSPQLTSKQSVPGRTPQTQMSSPNSPSGFSRLSISDDSTSPELDTFTIVSLPTRQDQSSLPVRKPKDKDRCVIA
ncbi:hypothetical protein C0Q70_02491 [Pomacea canaliculata]|uniref:Poly [ADP-ribose] polymerase n=1 Tax=Pomacea canaliculata TaxID=400727 RepID=A0A2T7PQ34_POMCA|nr:poly [ADP-ribose] polymerase 12-like [Pomacea canaliculata]PVD35528.1 hypothetical protein C0Q70_02491 [Pomacea canaliculata]